MSLCVFVRTGFLWSEWITDFRKKKEQNVRIWSLLQQPVDCSETFPPSPGPSLERCMHFLSSGGWAASSQHHFCESVTPKLKIYAADSLLLMRSAHFPCDKPIHRDRAVLLPASLHWIPPFSVFSSLNWKKPNVCLLSPVLSSGLPALTPSAPPSLAGIAWTALPAALQREPQRPKSYQLP